MASVHRRMVKRRLLMTEAQNKSNGGEVRRLHIVYFLCRNGRIEHPHLIRLNHLSTNGVRLRDVKRWLGELRGKNMPVSFAWSYKRKYKTGYLWQDLIDDDLITPISDNEYVLKGSEISNITTEKDKSNPMQKDQSEAATKDIKESTDQTSMYISTKSSPSISEEEESPVFTSSRTSTLTNEDHSGNIDHKIMNKKISSSTENTSLIMKREKNSLGSPYALVSDQIINKQKRVKRVSIGEGIKSTTTASSKPRKNNNGPWNHMLRNLITCCGVVEANDSAVVVMNKHQHNNRNSNSYISFAKMCSGDVRNAHSAEVYSRREKKSADGYDVVLQNMNHRSQSTARMKCNEENDSAKRTCGGREFSASYKPINGPMCSLCKKQFKPEKLHAHMISCKGRRKTIFKQSTSTNHSHESSTVKEEDYLGTRYLLAHH